MVLFTFVAKDMRLLRTIAIFSNLAFIAYGTIEWLPPVLFLHLALLQLNIVRLRDAVRARQATGDLTQANGPVPVPVPVPVQTLCPAMTGYSQPSAAPWPSFLSTPKPPPSLAAKQVTTVAR